MKLTAQYTSHIKQQVIESYHMLKRGFMTNSFSFALHVFEQDLLMCFIFWSD